MTREQDPVARAATSGPSEASAAHDGQDTLRSIEAAPELPPDASELYVEPQPLPKVSEHKTLEVDTIKLAADIDPRKRPTELKLGRVRRLPADGSPPAAPTAASPPSNPPEGIVAPADASADAPIARPANRALLAFAALLLLCVGAFALARGLRSRIAPSVATAPTAVAAAATPLAASAKPSLSPETVTTAARAAQTASAPPPTVDVAAANIAAAPAAAPALAMPPAASQKPAPPHTSSTHPDPKRAPPAPEAKPKHSIY